MAQRQYRNPPIEEAVCEFRFAPGSAWNFTVPGLFYEKIKDFYTGEPRQQNLVAAEFQTSPQPQNSEIRVRQTVNKILFPSANTTRLVGVGPDILSIHILRPYEGWDEFRGRISQALDVYLEVIKPVGVKRTALRYINRIVLPEKQNIDLSQYFTVYPQIPNEIQTRVSGFLNRTDLIYEDLPIQLGLTISDASDPIENPEIIIDLEISQEWTDSFLAPEEALSSLNELKQREGQAFESLITDRTRELFDGD
ncbi:TIGR04255 family protein [Scytonema sp. UIC 10036]|uniref:TIGR04255 family protein n=1 Tax=Scytonema sp. UIC 10036 TaxID=2304196 RepID=UPI0012DA15BF|nr:TIGR04255 family protein [Scytonema sp. UIC 10036]MUG97107.1 TIGR04255 family protein [Scytonema sp. UIC 10036]